MQVSYKVKARFLFVLPGVLFLLTVLGYPLGTLIYNSFFRYNFAGIAGRT
jgi:ABC-type sugar transport system permease subunit